MVKVWSSTTFRPVIVLALGFPLQLRVGALEVGESGDRLEEVAACLAVGGVGGAVPGIDEVLGLDLRAIVELVRLQLDGEVLVVGWSRSTPRCRSPGAAFSVLYRTSFAVMASTMSPPHASLVLPGISGFSGVQPER